MHDRCDAGSKATPVNDSRILVAIGFGRRIEMIRRPTPRLTASLRCGRARCRQRLPHACEKS